MSLSLCAALASCGGGNCPSGNSSTVATGSDIPLSEPMHGTESLSVSSTSFANGAAMPDAHVFSGFGCTGGNQSPALSWSGAPEGTQSFAIVAHDPDAPTGVGFFHWLAFDIPAATTSLPEGAATALPAGTISGRTDFGSDTYGGPCPPPGAPHRYIFTVYALDVPTLGLQADTTSGALLRFMLAQHTLAYGRTTGIWSRAAQ